MAFPGLCFDSWSVRLSSMDHFFSDICFFKNHPHTCPSSGLSEKTPGCQKRYWYSLHTPRNRSDAHFFYWFRCIIRFWNSLLSSNNPLLEKVVQADLLIANRSNQYMDLLGSARTPRFPCISAVFECQTISQIYPSKTVWAHFARTYHWELERTW